MVRCVPSTTVPSEKCSTSSVENTGPRQNVLTAFDDYVNLHEYAQNRLSICLAAKRKEPFPQRG
jgi:hypothetical protein